MRAILVCLAAIVALASCELGEDTSAAPVVADISRNYGQLRLMTPEPVFVNPEIAMLCRGANEADVAKAREKAGPHANTAIRIYMNGPAVEAFRKEERVFPEGSVVVKEKKDMGYFDKDRKTIVGHDGVGGMVKRQAGFDPEHGDWEYFYFEDRAKIESGKIASCVRCHAGASRDHVFGSWAKER